MGAFWESKHWLGQINQAYILLIIMRHNETQKVTPLHFKVMVSPSLNDQGGIHQSISYEILPSSLSQIAMFANDHEH